MNSKTEQSSEGNGSQERVPAPTIPQNGATSIEPKVSERKGKDDAWLNENLEATSKEMIKNYHDEVMVLKATIAEVMEKIEASTFGDDNNGMDIKTVIEDQSQKVEAIVAQASGDIVESVECVTKSVTKMSDLNQESNLSQSAAIKVIDERLADMQESLETQTKLLLAQTRQRQIHFAMSNTDKFSFSYRENGRKKESAALVEEILWLFQKNYALILPEQAVYLESTTQVNPSNKFGGGGVLRDQVEIDEEEGKEAFRGKLMDQLEMLLGVRPTLEAIEGGQHVVRLDF